MRQWTGETTKRALRTFAQAFVAFLVAGLPLLDWTDTSAIKAAGVGLLISAIAAGIAAVMNLEFVPNGKPPELEIDTEDQKAYDEGEHD